MEMPRIHRPVPQRAFELTPASTESSLPPSPSHEQTSPDLLSPRRSDPSLAPSRTRSILNLTSSTLLGIYSGATDGGREELNTPWGTGAQTPNLRRSVDGERLEVPTFDWNNRRQSMVNFHKVPRKGFKGYYGPLFLQTALLFVFGMAYGLLITEIHKTQQIAPIPVPEARENRWYYRIAWGVLGVIIGNALPRIDEILDDDEVVIEDQGSTERKPLHIRAASNSSRPGSSRSENERNSLVDSGLGPLWQSSVRSVGAFIGIAYALRRVPWQSTLQVSSTLAVSNPVLWYLIDRSKPGLAVSTTVSILGTFLLLLINPNFVPVPHIHQQQASEQYGVYIWLASILFCTSLCFGAIGRKLQL